MTRNILKIEIIKHSRVLKNSQVRIFIHFCLVTQEVYAWKIFSKGFDTKKTLRTSIKILTNRRISLDYVRS